jgi:hypothetical protein
MPAYGSKEVDTSTIAIPGVSGVGNRQARAIAGCQNPVRRSLRSTTIAKFINPPAVLTTDSTMEIIGRVDAMNGVGGYGTVTYHCSGSNNPDDWVTPAVTLSERR